MDGKDGSLSVFDALRIGKYISASNWKNISFEEGSSDTLNRYGFKKNALILNVDVGRYGLTISDTDGTESHHNGNAEIVLSREQAFELYEILRFQFIEFENFRLMAENNGLSESTAEKFAIFMTLKFPDERVGSEYCSEWLQRFKDGTAYTLADPHGKNLIKQLLG